MPKVQGRGPARGTVSVVTKAVISPGDLGEVTFQVYGDLLPTAAYTVRQLGPVSRLPASLTSAPVGFVGAQAGLLGPLPHLSSLALQPGMQSTQDN